MAGKAAARSLLAKLRRATLYPGAWVLDRWYKPADVPAASFTDHRRLRDHVIKVANQSGLRVLEVGSRTVTGTPPLRDEIPLAEYVGFDYYAGPNVDVVGDAHRLSTYFDRPFDIVYSAAVFEHLAMPWIVAQQIAKVMKVGASVFIETHFSTSSHERPWHFFQFSDMGLRVLFPPAAGFVCDEASMSSPMIGRFSVDAAAYLRLRPTPGLFCHSAFAGRKVREVDDFRWELAALPELTGGTHYPVAHTS